MEIECSAQGFALSLVAGGCLIVIWLALYLLAWVWAWCWSWVDDAKVVKRNPLLRLIMQKMGWIEHHESFLYEKDDDYSDGAVAFLIPLCVLGFAPPLIFISIYLYPITIFCFALLLIAHIARFARRHKKLFDKHIKDPGAHK